MKDEVGRKGRGGGLYVPLSLGLILCPLCVRVTQCGKVFFFFFCVV